MIDFLQPGWMYAAAGIALPVAVHLWNVRRGKVLKVGSVALLLQQTTKNTSSIQLHQLLLLVLRCMLMVLLALLLAKPLWVGNSRYAAGWVLLDKNDVPQT
ncbi:MAG TPA: BatA domain-containing protein, partial [Chitinophagaceae bacterium]|nr:BatA domain-containing protein [Chitinophagaceae bacterium]